MIVLKYKHILAMVSDFPMSPYHTRKALSFLREMNEAKAQFLCPKLTPIKVLIVKLITVYCI